MNKLQVLKPVLIHPLTGEPKHCFPSASGEILFCNFTERAGKIWRFSKVKDYLTIPIKWKRKRRNQKSSEDFIQKKNEPASKQSSSSN